jgi:predicted O-methyltransferase YrrM
MALLEVDVLREVESLEREGASHDASEPERRRKRLNLERPAAELLYFLIRSTGRRRVLEIGTSNGLSTIWIQAALAGTGGTLVTIDREAAKLEEARRNLTKTGLLSGATLLEGDATELVRRLDGPFDAVFFDADRVSAPEQLAILLPRLSTDALLLSDNVLSHPSEVAGYLTACEHLPGFVSTIVPVGKGLHVAHRRGSPTP